MVNTVTISISEYNKLRMCQYLSENSDVGVVHNLVYECNGDKKEIYFNFDKKGAIDSVIQINSSLRKTVAELRRKNNNQFDEISALKTTLRRISRKYWYQFWR